LAGPEPMLPSLQILTLFQIHLALIHYAGNQISPCLSPKIFVVLRLEK
jgi:hypothetical protein